jgi:hypothetical protein
MGGTSWLAPRDVVKVALEFMNMAGSPAQPGAHRKRTDVFARRARGRQFMRTRRDAEKLQMREQN